MIKASFLNFVPLWLCAIQLLIRLFPEHRAAG